MRDAKWKKVADKISRKINQTWGTPHEFSKTQVGKEPAYYTIIRALDNRLKPPKFETLAMIAFYAGFTPTEIRQMAEDVGATPWDRLIGGNGESLGTLEKALLSAARKLAEANGKTMHRLAGNLEVLAEAAGVDISTELKTLGG